MKWKIEVESSLHGVLWWEVYPVRMVRGAETACVELHCFYEAALWYWRTGSMRWKILFWVVLHSHGLSPLQLFKCPGKRSNCLLTLTIFFNFVVFVQRYEIERVLTIAKTDHDKLIDILHELILFYNGLLLVYLTMSSSWIKFFREFKRIWKYFGGIHLSRGSWCTVWNLFYRGRSDTFSLTLLFNSFCFLLILTFVHSQRVAYRLSTLLTEDEQLKVTNGEYLKRSFIGQLCEMVIVCSFSEPYVSFIDRLV